MFYERYQGKFVKHLKDVIKVEHFKDGIGIGNVATMTAETPYWRVVNDGGYVPPKTHGFFGSGNPQGGAGGDSSFTFSKNGPQLVPTTPIPAMRYIEKTAAWVEANIRRFLDKKIVEHFKDFRQKSLVRLK